MQVSSVPFDTTAAKAAAKQLTDAQAAQRTATYLDLGKKAALGLVVLIVLFLAWRRRGSTAAATRVSALARDLPAEGTVLVGGAITDGHPPALTAAPAPDTASDPAVRLKREQMRSELAAFVDSQPDEIAQLVQSWLAERKS